MPHTDLANPTYDSRLTPARPQVPQEEEVATAFVDLPTDMLLHIIGFLRDPGSLCSLGQVGGLHGCSV